MCDGTIMCVVLLRLYNKLGCCAFLSSECVRSSLGNYTLYSHAIEYIQCIAIGDTYIHMCSYNTLLVKVCYNMRYGVVTQLRILMYEKRMILFNLHVIVILEKD